MDVWDEDDFILSSKQGETFQVLNDWSDLLHSYSDTHDGAYLEWGVNSMAHRNQEANTIKTKSPRKTSNIKNASQKVINSADQKSIGFEIVAPPVPVAIYHPSCWGVNSRQTALNTQKSHQEKEIVLNNKNGKYIDIPKNLFECIHPGSLSDIKVSLPGIAADKLDDIDDLNLHTELILQELYAIDCSNYIRLQKLEDLSNVFINIDKISKKRKYMSDLLTHMYQNNNYQSTGRVIYANKPPVEEQTSSIFPPTPSVLPPTIAPAPTSSRYGTRCASTSMLKLASENLKGKQIQLGACMQKHCPYGTFISGLQKGDLVELFREGGWRAGQIINMRLDGHLLRYLKVSPLGSAPGDHSWVAVEDGRLAPPGANLEDTMFKWFDPSYEAYKDPNNGGYITSILGKSESSDKKNGMKNKQQTDINNGLKANGRQNGDCQSYLSSHSSVSSFSSLSHSMPPKVLSSKILPSSTGTGAGHPKGVNGEPSKAGGNKNPFSTYSFTSLSSSTTSSSSSSSISAPSFLSLTEAVKGDPYERVVLWNTLKNCRMCGGNAPYRKDLQEFLSKRYHFNVS